MYKIEFQLKRRVDQYPSGQRIFQKYENVIRKYLALFRIHKTRIRVIDDKLHRHFLLQSVLISLHTYLCICHSYKAYRRLFNISNAKIRIFLSDLCINISRVQPTRSINRRRWERSRRKRFITRVILPCILINISYLRKDATDHKLFVGRNETNEALQEKSDFRIEGVKKPVRYSKTPQTRSLFEQ